MKQTETNTQFAQVPERQASAGTVDPADFEKYGMEKATQLAIKRAEDKARFDSQPKVVSAPPPTQT